MALEEEAAPAVPQPAGGGPDAGAAAWPWLASFGACAVLLMLGLAMRGTILGAIPAQPYPAEEEEERGWLSRTFPNRRRAGRKEAQQPPAQEQPEGSSSAAHQAALKPQLCLNEMMGNTSHGKRLQFIVLAWGLHKHRTGLLAGLRNWLACTDQKNKARLCDARLPDVDTLEPAELIRFFYKAGIVVVNSGLMPADPLSAASHEFDALRLKARDFEGPYQYQRVVQSVVTIQWQELAAMAALGFTLLTGAPRHMLKALDHRAKAVTGGVAKPAPSYVMHLPPLDRAFVNNGGLLSCVQSCEGLVDGLIQAEERAIYRRGLREEFLERGGARMVRFREKRRVDWDHVLELPLRIERADPE